MNNEIKNVLFKKSFILIVLILFIISVMFYWFAYRPSKIRHDCSWVRMVDPAIPTKPAITKEDVKNSQLEYDECTKELAELNKYNNSSRKRIFTNDGIRCDSLLKQERQLIPAESERIWYKKANKDKYNFCIHEKGLLE